MYISNLFDQDGNNNFMDVYPKISLELERALAVKEQVFRYASPVFAELLVELSNSRIK
jgi:hypothetical protein